MTGQAPATLQFTDSPAAMRYCALHLDTRVEAGRGLLATVQAVDGIRKLYELRVCSSDGDFLAVAKTVGDQGPALQTGDLVIWVPDSYSAEIAAVFDDQRGGWIGLIVAAVKPELVDGRWTVRGRYSR